MYTTPYHTRDLSNISFLITGGAGFIGSNIVEYLLKYGAKKVRVLDNFSTGYKKNIKPFLANPAFELIEGDIRDIEVCRHAVNGIDCVSHQAALGSVPRSINDPVTTNDVNISGFLNILLASKDEGIKYFVYAASSSTYGDHPSLPKVEDKIGNPLSPYAVTKYVNELYASVFSRTYNFHTIGLRYFNVFGPRQNPSGAYAAVIPLFINAAAKKEIVTINGDGQTSRDFTFIENVVQANIKALLIEPKNHEVINIAVGERTTLNQLWKYICNLNNVDIEPNYQQERRGDVKHSLANIQKAESLINYKPQISIKKGLEISVVWYAQQ
ncbi:SDR family oxidoreductase [Mucilaginibacter sp. RB4R14]|uniref:SDR family oxidoreductase n=1 Tax=Mucilaginibacter aurantiaciroseus TaxID=2949308 RepID=UPI0020911CCD|nr:SDR family oxidoreductase [Mucilaginibacter aurantiaciroseus]MCO5935980.1 SDR family oxidoreductase [Mucilaginibacter aurantiaciroseus]